MKRDKNGYHELTDGARFRLNLDKDWLLLACCGCSLVHKMRFRERDGILFVRISLEEKETRTLRAKKKRR